MSAQFRNESGVVAGPAADGGLDDVRDGLVQLHAKVDAFFAAVLARHRLRMQCGAGCASCCQRMPSVFPVEAWLIAQGLRQQPEAMVERLQRRLARVAQQAEVAPCPLLDERRHCRIYATRPLHCRSAGAPIQVPGQPLQRWLVCPLNFHAPAMRAAVQASDLLDVERLNEILSVVDSLFQQAYPSAAGLPLRMPLASGVLHFLRSEPSG